MATIIDIARECGVSPATVSYALNNKGHVSEEMRAQIREVAKKLNYVPSQAARNLQKGRSNVVALIIPELTSFFNNQVFSHLEQEIRARDLQVIVGFSSNKTTTETALFLRMVAQAPLGILWFPSVEATEQTVQEVDAIVSNHRIPTVAVYKKTVETRYLKYLEWDIRDAARQITGMLLDAGDRDVRFFGPRNGGVYLKEKQEGYRAAFEERSRAVPELICDMEEHYCAAKEYMTDYLKAEKPLPQAIVAVNDIAGYGILRALEERGVSVPKEVRVVGIDGIRFDYADARLTTVSPGLQLLATRCVEILCRFEKESKMQYSCENRIWKGTTSN